MNEVASKLILMHNNENRLTSKLEFMSTLSDIGTTEMQDKLICSDKKVHWNCKYVQLLLDCVESRLHEFKNKSIHKKVWDEIGKEMQIYGFSTEHCYNKWKNLRRDVRMFAINPNKATKNQEILNRVRKLISTICPNFDPTAVYKKNSTMTKISSKSQSEELSNSLEPLNKLLEPTTSPFSDILTPMNNDENIDMSTPDEEILSSNDQCHGSVLDMKLNLNSDVYSYLLRQHNSQLLLHASNTNNIVNNQNLFLNGSATVCNSEKDSAKCLQSTRLTSNTNTKTVTNSNTNNTAATAGVDHKSVMSNSDNENETNNNSNSNNYSTSWPYELYDLLVSFRTEEIKQAHSIDQLLRQINEIRDSSVRRMNTIQQLMNLANLLISSKVV